MSTYIHTKDWRIRHPGKVKAYRRVYVAKRNGSLLSQPCHCGEIKSEAHHVDYRRPLEVIWLCKKHHIEADYKRKSGKLPVK